MKIGFNDCEIDTDLFQISRAGVAVDLTPLTARLLTYLIDNRHRVVSKDELVEKVWDRRIVTDATVTTAIKEVRLAIGDNGRVQHTIRTVHGIGYRFVADISLPQAAEPESPAETSTVAEVAPRQAPAIVVLPFEDLGPDDSRDYLVEGLTEEVIVALSRFKELAVVAISSAFEIARMERPPLQVTRELGARYLVSGSVRRGIDRVRVSVQLTDAEDGSRLWVETYERKPEDLIDLQATIAGSIAGVLPGRVGDFEVVRTLDRPVRDLSALQAYQRVNWQFRRHRSISKALSELDSLLELADDFALAHAKAAVMKGFVALTGGRRDDDLRKKSIAHAKTAIAIDPTDARVQSMAGSAHLYVGDFIPAREHTRRAVELNPNSVEANHFRAIVLGASGDAPLALEYHEQAMRLDPYFPEHYFEGAIEAHYLLGDYEAAIDLFQRWTDPFGHVLFTAAACYAMAGNRQEAIRLARALETEKKPGFSIEVYVDAMLNYHAREEDRRHWQKGFERAGLI